MTSSDLTPTPPADRDKLARRLWNMARVRGLEAVGLPPTAAPNVNWEATDQASWLADADALLDPVSGVFPTPSGDRTFGASSTNALAATPKGDREAIATLIRHELAKDNLGFGSCDIGATIADALIAAGLAVTPNPDAHDCNNMRFDLLAKIAKLEAAVTPNGEQAARVLDDLIVEVESTPARDWHGVGGVKAIVFNRAAYFKGKRA